MYLFAPARKRPRDHRGIGSISLEFSQPMISPVDFANPAFSAAYSPWFAWLNQQLTSRSYFRIISAVRSVDPSSTTMYSRFGYPWFTIDRIVASRYSSPLYTAVTSVIFGHSLRALCRSSSSRSHCATLTRASAAVPMGCASVVATVVSLIGMAGCRSKGPVKYAHGKIYYSGNQEDLL